MFDITELRQIRDFYQNNQHEPISDIWDAFVQLLDFYEEHTAEGDACS